MRLLTAAVAATAITVAGTLAAPSYADPSPALPDQASEQAVEALEDAKKALEGKGDVDPTLAMAELQTVDEDLPKGKRDDARALFARPDDSSSPGDHPDAVWESDAIEENSCTNWPTLTTHVCVHYVSPSDTDSFHTASHQWAAETARYMQAVWNREVTSQGYDAPLSDLAEPTNNGGDGKLDIYLSELGDLGLYGYAVPEEDARQSYSYLVLDNDYAQWQYNAPPLVSLKATAAHEFFHAVQFAYDVGEDLWFMESTATWMEEQTFDEVNDNRYFITSSSLHYPHVPLNSGGGAVYGNWVYFQFLSEWLGAPVVRTMWEQAQVTNWQSLRSIEATLAARGQNFAAVFSAWSAANNVPGTFYSEGRFFPVRPVLSGNWSLRGGAGTGTKSLRLNHLASRNYRFRPASSGAWRLRVVVNGPTGDSTAYALAHLRDGRIYRAPIRLNAAGDGSRYIAFNRSSISAVTLNLGNASKAVNNRYYEFNVRVVR